jgi:hypothetical protein
MGELTAWAHLRASGHLTSAPSDALVAFAQDKAAAKTILLAAQEMEKSTQDDYAAYCEAYDAGAFAATLAHLDKAKGDEAA